MFSWLPPACHTTAPVWTCNSHGRSPAHNCTWISFGLVQLVRANVNRNYKQDLYGPLFRTFCCHLLGHLFNVVVGRFNTKRKLFGRSRVFVDLVANFCSFSESKRRVCTLCIFNSDSTLHFRQFTRSLVLHSYVYAQFSHVHPAIVMCTCTQPRSPATLTIILNFHEESFHGQMSNHEIPAILYVPQKFGAIQ